MTASTLSVSEAAEGALADTGNTSIKAATTRSCRIIHTGFIAMIFCFIY